MFHLKVQDFISQHGLDKLTDKLGIKVFHHPTLPLVGLKYSQIDSPRTHPVVRECRGLVLEDKTWKLVAKPFDRFFNVGEVQDEFAKFNWNKFTCVNKEDGSLIIVYYYNGEWLVNTSGSFGLGPATMFDGTWQDLFWKYTNLDSTKLVPGFTYCFELCTPYNKVVKSYPRPMVFLIGVVENAPLVDWPEWGIDDLARKLNIPRPIIHTARTQKCVADLLFRMEDAGELNEGVIIRDCNGVRFKWKTKRYLALHRLKDNGNVLLPRRLVDVVLTGETNEVLAVMPEISGALKEVEREINRITEEINNMWFAYGDIKSQKKFALKVKNYKMCWILFQMRKMLVWEERDFYKEIRKLMLEQSRKISDALFGKKIFQFDNIIG